MTRDEAFKEINDTQDYYVSELQNMLLKNTELKEINFSSDTGTGKTKMMSKLINKMSDYFFIVTTLSKGQLNKQIEKNLNKDCLHNNFKVHGVCDYTANTRLTYNDILNELPIDKKIIWLRDEGHIHTNKWQPLLEDRCYRIVNISATNNDLGGIECNFKHTMMLRTVIQQCGEIGDALDKLIEIKKQHNKVKDYNPCAILRCLSPNVVDIAVNECIKRNLKYINITVDDYDMSDICEDNNEYDVIINKFKIVEGIDIRRAHVIWLENEPGNSNTTIQLIGRCRRNALLYRDDIDIFKPSNEKLLENTRQCYAFYNILNMKVDSDDDGNLVNAFCDIISCQKLKVGSIIAVKNGKMTNGLTVSELQGYSGQFEIKQDEKTGFNIVYPFGDYYKQITNKSENVIYLGEKEIYTQKDIMDLEKDLKLTTLSHLRYVYNKRSHIKEAKLSDFLGINTTKAQVGWSTQESEYKYVLFGKKLDKQDIMWYKKEIQGYLDKREELEYKDFSIRKVRNKDNFKLTYKKINAFASNPICFWDTQDENNISLEQYIHRLNYYKLSYTYSELEEQFSSKSDVIKRKNELKKQKISIKCKFLLGTKEVNIEEYKNHLINVLDNIKYTSYSHIKLDDLKRVLNHCYRDYIITLNDKELAILAGENYHYHKETKKWLESKSITSLVNRYCKFNTFIEDKYKQELEYAKKFTYNGKNNFNLDTRCNACLGYCVEYYSKYLVYGQDYLEEYIDKAKKESKVDTADIGIIVRACMLKYKENMAHCYGIGIARLIKTISIEQLVKQKYKDFLELVIKLGTRTANFIKQNLTLNINKIDEDKGKICVNQIEPGLITSHFVGLCDYIDENTIIDIKTTSNITIKYVKQVLAYHYLSTKRSDLHIKQVVIYDAVKDKNIKIKISDKNLNNL